MIISINGSFHPFCDKCDFVEIVSDECSGWKAIPEGWEFITDRRNTCMHYMRCARVADICREEKICKK